MKQVLFDDVLREKLSDLGGPIELCDEDGRVLARVVPTPDPDWEPPISKEELRQRFEDPGRLYTTAGVLAYLESL